MYIGAQLTRLGNGNSLRYFAPWLVGASNVILGGRFSPEAWYEALQDYGVTVWYSAPTAFRMLMGAGQDAIKNMIYHKYATC